jgi:prophage regulatory protein
MRRDDKIPGLTPAETALVRALADLATATSQYFIERARTRTDPQNLGDARPRRRPHAAQYLRDLAAESPNDERANLERIAADLEAAPAALGTNFLRLKQVAKRYGVSRVTVWRWTKDGILPTPAYFGRHGRQATPLWNAADLDRHDADRVLNREEKR